MSTIVATNINTDALVGNTSANAITVRGEGSATTSLQQGLAKVFLDYDQDGTVAIDKSFNVSTVTDNEEGKYTQNWTNPMDSANYAVVGMRRGYHLIEDTDSNSKLSTSIKIRSWYVSSTAGGRTNQDSSSNMTILNGDLA